MYKFAKGARPPPSDRKAGYVLGLHAIFLLGLTIKSMMGHTTPYYGTRNIQTGVTSETMQRNAQLCNTVCHVAPILTFVGRLQGFLILPIGTLLVQLGVQLPDGRFPVFILGHGEGRSLLPLIHSKIRGKLTENHLKSKSLASCVQTHFSSASRVLTVSTDNLALDLDNWPIKSESINFNVRKMKSMSKS